MTEKSYSTAVGEQVINLHSSIEAGLALWTVMMTQAMWLASIYSLSINDVIPDIILVFQRRYDLTPEDHEKAVDRARARLLRRQQITEAFEQQGVGEYSSHAVREYYRSRGYHPRFPGDTHDEKFFTH